MVVNLPAGAKMWDLSMVGGGTYNATVEIEVSEDGFTYETLAEYSVNNTMNGSASSFQSIEAYLYHRITVADLIGTFKLVVTV